MCTYGILDIAGMLFFVQQTDKTEDVFVHSLVGSSLQAFAPGCVVQLESWSGRILQKKS